MPHDSFVVSVVPIMLGRPWASRHAFGSDRDEAQGSAADGPPPRRRRQIPRARGTSRGAGKPDARSVCPVSLCKEGTFIPVGPTHVPVGPTHIPVGPTHVQHLTVLHRIVEPIISHRPGPPRAAPSNGLVAAAFGPWRQGCLSKGLNGQRSTT